VSGELVFVVHAEADIRERVSKGLADGQFKVLAFPSDQEAGERIESQRFLLPDAILMPLDSISSNGSNGSSGDVPPLLQRLRANPVTESIPVVVLSGGAEADRRRALRLGLTGQVMPPYDQEEVQLSVRLALERRRDERLVSGSIAQLPVTDLLQTSEAGRRSGTFTFRRRGLSATLWMRDGRIVDAEADGGRSGEEVVYALAAWEDGTFEVDFGEVSVPERIQTSTSGLLLEAMRRRDEAHRDGAFGGGLDGARDAPPHAALEDPPPPPPRELRTIHRALTLLNVAASYAVEHVEPELVERRLEQVRSDLLADHPALDCFRVRSGGQVTVEGAEASWTDLDAEVLAQAVGTWVRVLFERFERGLRGRFPVERLRALTGAIHGDLEALGFYRALGLERDLRDDDQEAPRRGADGGPIAGRPVTDGRTA